MEILQNVAELKKLGFPVLIGASRKVFLAKILQKTTSELLPATLVMHTVAIQQGADLLRVHDVAEHRDLVKLLSQLTAVAC